MKKLLFIALLVCSNTLIYAHAPLHIIQNKQQVSLSNGELLLKFESDDTFKFLGLSHNHGKTWSVARQQDLVWQLNMKGATGSTITLNSRNTEYQGVDVVEERDKKSLVFSWLYPSVGGKIFMQVSINSGNTLSDW